MSRETERVLEEIARRYHLSLVMLFGSHAADLSTSESDMDIAVLTERPDRITSLAYHLDLGAELSKCLQTGEIDLAFLNNADPLLRAEVARRGRILFEKDDAFAHFAVRAMKEFEDARQYRFRILREVLEDFYGSAARKHPA
jgi:predicted nucleotidyltransferase